MATLALLSQRVDIAISNDVRCPACSGSTTKMLAVSGACVMASSCLVLFTRVPTSGSSVVTCELKCRKRPLSASPVAPTSRGMLMLRVCVSKMLGAWCSITTADALVAYTRLTSGQHGSKRRAPKPCTWIFH